MSIRSRTACAAWMSLALAASAAPGAIMEFTLTDHPGGNINPPPYGLRLDGAFASLGGTGGPATFSFDAALNDDTRDNVTLTMDTTTNAITIAGEIYGGEYDNGSYGFGEGWYDLSFTYSTNVAPDGDGWFVDGDPLANLGTLTSQASSSLGPGEVITFFDSAMPDSFLFLPDGYRIDGNDSSFVGRGWFSLDPDGGSPPPGSSLDWLFIGVPAPSTGALLALGLLATNRTSRRTAS